MADSILIGLNAAQKSAVTSPGSVLQILAPPGSGKTKTLTSRVAFLLSHHGFQPRNTLCLTFTIKSAKEMKDRLSKLIGNSLSSQLVLGTFHSICRRYLVSYGHLIGIRKGFGIADSSDTLAIITRITKRFKLNLDPKAARSRISVSKARGSGLDDLTSKATSKKRTVDQEEFLTIFEAYESHLTTSNLLDYDDLLLRCADLLRQHPACVSNVEVVLIDEFQDTNTVQFELMILFAAKRSCITTVGDPDQSIYGWRSAEVKNLVRMQQHYPDTLVIHLEDNYRSSGAILLAALEVIQQDGSRPSKALLPTHCPGTVPVLRRLPSATTEASWIVSEILRSTSLTGHLLTYSDFAILLRSASLSRHIESAMGKAGIPYRMVGGQRFFDRVEIKILLDYLRVISQPDNSDAFARIINTPSRRIGEATIKALVEEAVSRHTTLWNLIREHVLGKFKTKAKISKAADQGLGSLTHMILTIRKKILDQNTHYLPQQLLEHVIKKLDFKEYLIKSYPDEHESRWANVEELVVQASDAAATDLGTSSESSEDESLPQIKGVEQDSMNAAEQALSKFLANVALSTELQKDDEIDESGKLKEKITISTIHAAKGLEWPVVFIPSAYDGSIPHSRAEDIDEERRLLYVAMTRAQALLYMSCPLKNSMREDTTLSPFLMTKQVSSLLTNKGPSLRFTATHDISRILRRDCPPEVDLLRGINEADNLEDDMWPLNGAEDSEIAESRWDSVSFPSTDRLSKRHKTSHDIGRGLVQKNNLLAPQYSAQMTSGFISATSQLQNMKEETRIHTRKPQSHTSKTSSQPKSTGDSSNVSANAQVNIKETWGYQNSRSHLPGISKTTAISIVRSYPYNNEAVEFDEAKSTHASHASNPRDQISSIPSSLASHSLKLLSRNRTLTSPPTDETRDKNAYVFLSSSPPVVSSTSNDQTQTKNKSGSYVVAKGNILLSTLSRTPLGPVLQPRSNQALPTIPYSKISRYDTRDENVLTKSEMSALRSSPPVQVTSAENDWTQHGVLDKEISEGSGIVAGMHAASKPRKTLGVRRSMVGWSSRGHHSFQNAR